MYMIILQVVENINNLNTKSSQYKLTKKQRNMDQNASDEASCRSSSNMFTVKVIIAWLIICLPGNIFAIVCIYGTEGSDITSSHQKQTNFSDGNFVNFSLRSQQSYSNFSWNEKFFFRHLKTDQENVSTFHIYD